MSKVDNLDDIGEIEAATGDSVVAEVLAQLKEKLEMEISNFEQATRAVQQLKIAIAAIERDAEARAHAIASQRPTRKKGQLSRAILDCIREGVGTVAFIHKMLEERGVTTTGPSISNAIHRMQGKKIVRYHVGLARWVSFDQNESYPRPEEPEHNEKASH